MGVEARSGGTRQIKITVKIWVRERFAAAVAVGDWTIAIRRQLRHALTASGTKLDESTGRAEGCAAAVAMGGGAFAAGKERRKRAATIVTALDRGCGSL